MFLEVGGVLSTILEFCLRCKPDMQGTRSHKRAREGSTCFGDASADSLCKRGGVAIG